jgi:membrane dipeptidase
MRGPAISAEARAFHESLIVVDGHCDTALELLGERWSDGQAVDTPIDRDFLVRGTSGHLDLPRLVEAGVTCQTMALFTSTERVGEATAWTWRLLEAVEDLYARSADFVPALRAEDIRRAKQEGRVAGLFAIEGGEALGGPDRGLENLNAFYARGVRLVTLTWSRRNALGRGVTVPGDDGLSDFGERVVKEMERLGMIVDASHLSDEALLDLLEIAQRPIVASHSNCRELCPHPRNLTDELAKRIAATGGLVGLTFAGVFIDSDPAKVSFDRFMEHLERMISVVGVEHVGLGSDFDGWTEKYGVALPDCTWLPAITAALLERGYAEGDVAAIMGGNWLRVIGEIAG